jgi:uncharacterized protein (TIRG00374 family)
MTGEIMFSYLRSKGSLNGVSWLRMARIALELNFVDHIVPIPAAGGISYLGWALHHYGIPPSRATMSQVVRLITMFISFAIIMFIAVVYMAFDYSINKVIVVSCAILIITAATCSALVIYLVSDNKRLAKVPVFLTKILNKTSSRVTNGKKRQLIEIEVVKKFFYEIHRDYLEISRNKKLLVRPLMWAFPVAVTDVALFAVVFLALGHWVNPAILLVAFELSMVASVIAVTPGSSGVYEAVMIGFLVACGVPADIAIAGTLLARAAILVTTILFGYIFYQLTVNKYGKAPRTTGI